MNLKPMYNMVLVKPNPINYVSKGNIIATETQTRAVNMQTGKVIAVGHGMITPEGNIVPLQVKVGDTIMFLRGTGIQIKDKIDAEELFMFKETELFGIVEQLVTESFQETVHNVLNAAEDE